ncbi:MAG: hypothetical protein WAQ53_12360 [Thiofilum sp.]|uniref:hypothetical protein n=1 Tax=Thiofilum sp. TaxID=2212733 RepID=UPI0025E9BBB9|nr:hypothetical protein [Thiofilum sp.]MBK8454312.1 hypothetical protein [Thiofilum sp.]
MYRNKYNYTRIFAEQELSVFLNTRKQNVIATIESENDDYLLNVNEIDYIKYKVSEAEVEPLIIHNDRIYVSSTEQMISGEYFPKSFFVDKGYSYKKSVIKFHIPFSGNTKLLSCQPSTRIVWSMNIEINHNEICFEIINFNDDIDSIIREKDDHIKSILQQNSYLESEVKTYNKYLESSIKTAFEARKKRILANSGVLASLGIPIKKSSSPSNTFSVPLASNKKSITILKPIVQDTIFKPEPTLDNTTYQEILKMIHDIGRQFERLPSLYKNKEEEDLRDHFLMFLEPNFEGSATGETFNKSGKTDILLRHEGQNIFIGECKFWKGQKVFLDTISQLLGYLTWRDSKAAVIMFVSNKDFTSTLEITKNSVNSHPNFIRYIDERDETWLNYEFHLNNDRNRVVKIAIMLYHLPK